MSDYNLYKDPIRECLIDDKWVRYDICAENINAYTEYSNIYLKYIGESNNIKINDHEYTRCKEIHHFWTTDHPYKKHEKIEYITKEEMLL